MSFLTPFLLAGAAAFLIPLIIHLLNRRKEQLVRWGPMHLLHEVIRQKKRRFRVEQWLLLLLRVALPIILALCLARPVMTALKNLPGLNKTSLVVLLDDSFSMRAPREDGTAQKQAQLSLERIAQELPGGSDVQVITAGGAPRRVQDSSTMLDLLPKTLSAVPSLAGPVQPNEALQSAVAAAAQAPSGMREVLVVSDFQKSDWQAFVEGAALPALDALAKQDPKPVLTFYRVASDLGENLAVASFEVSAHLAAEGQLIGAKVRIKNHGKRLQQDVPVHLEADGARIRTTRVTVPAEGEATLTLTHSFDKAGDHALAVRIEGDTLTEDNAATAIVQVRTQVRVLLLTEDERSADLEGALDFVELALMPNDAVEEKTLKDLIQTQRLDFRRLRREDLKGVEVVIAADMDRPERLRQLEEYVEQGGGLILFPGPHSQTESWQRDYARVKFLPAQVKGLQSASGAAARLVAQRFTHPALSYFSDGRAGRLADAEIQTWWTLEPRDDEAKVLLSLDRGSPMLVERSYGQGRVILAASTASPDWGTLPIQPYFVPLMQRLVAHLASQSGASRSFLVGQSLQVAVANAADTNKNSTRPTSLLTAREGESFTLKAPTDEDAELKVQKQGNTLELKSKPTVSPGVYALARPGSGETGAMKFAVNVDPAEADLRPLSDEDVKELAGRFGAGYADSLTSYQALDRERRHGSEVWQIFLLLLLLLLFGEVLLAQRISRA
jgi:hypothetical protein